MITDKQVFENQDLVLKVSQNVDPTRLDLKQIRGILLVFYSFKS